MKTFKPGDTVIFDPDSFSSEYWINESEDNKKKYYGCFGYGSNKLKLFTFLCKHSPQSGHCTLMDLETGQLLPMCHINNFRLATEKEC